MDHPLTEPFATHQTSREAIAGDQTAEIQLDKHIPIPRGGAGRKAIYPWKKLAVGDSFLLNPDVSHPSSYVSSANRLNQPRKFVVRKDGVRYRVWRVK